MASATFSIDGQSIASGLVTVLPGASVPLAVLDLAGIQSIAWSCVGTHSASVTPATITAAISPAGSPPGATGTLSFPAGTDGQCYRIRCRVIDSRNKAVDAFGLVGSENWLGRVPFCAGEILERDLTQGWTDALNQAVPTATGAANVDTSVSSTSATPATVSTITIDQNHVYEFGVYVQAYGAAATTRLVQKFSALYERLTGAPTLIETSPLVDKQSTDIATIAGLELAVSGNDIIVRWTGHASVNLNARVQVGYVKRPVVLYT